MAKSRWIGKSLSKRYQIEEMLGQGGMSAVYKATDPNLKRVVAIKMIHSHLSSDPDFVKRFEEEATAVAQLRHPNIIQVYDFNRDDDAYYMVLEFVPGETIQQHLKRLNERGRNLSVSKVIEYMAGVCDAVDYAHQRGMIHRDIKPANLMLNTLDQVILMDFGIAKIVGGQRHTATGAVVGTAMYMSPEQIKGESPDRRTDIYSLGVTLFEMVGGQPPFEADSAMTLMMMHINDPVPDPRKLNPDVPDDLVAAINKALAKDPNDRYQTCAQMAAALRNVLARIKSGASLESPVVGGTMMEESPLPSAYLGATSYEAPVAGKGTVVESGPLPASPQGTYVESGPRSSSPQGTVVESGPLMGAGAAGKYQGGTSIESPPARPMPPPSAPPSKASPKVFGLALPVIGVGILVLACLVVGGGFLISQLIGGGGANSATEAPVVPAIVDTPSETVTSAPTEDISTPTIVPTETPIPTPTVPPGPYVRINSITVDGNNNYVVEYETFEFTEQLPGMHIHFFFNTVSPENAGSPGSGPWYLYGGPRPFTKYRVSDRPSEATQMCALVANSNHSLFSQTSGNCMDLP
jgi:serine/threonine protein kinase